MFTTTLALLFVVKLFLKTNLYCVLVLAVSVVVCVAGRVRNYRLPDGPMPIDIVLGQQLFFDITNRMG